MNRKERIRAVMERFVMHLWMTALIILGIRFFLPGPPAEARRPNTGPHWCAPDAPATAAECRWLPDELTLTIPSKEQASAAFYLARPFSHGPCGFFPQELSRSFADVLADCDAELVHEAGNIDLCKPGPDKGRVYRIPADEAGPCATIVGGPYGPDGQTIPGRSIPPFLSIFPALEVTSELLDFVESRKRYDSGYEALRPLEGSAFAGWLLLPLHGLDIPVASLHNAQHLLTRAAAAVNMPPVPNPVLLDLAGLSLCPTVEAMPRILAEMDAVGLRPIGQTTTTPATPAHLLRIVPLARQGKNVAQVVSVRLTMATDECQTLQSSRPTELAPLLAESITLADLGDVPTALMLHRTDGSVSDAAMASLLEELDALALDLLVAVFGKSAAGPLRSGANGPRILDMGVAVHEDSLFPAAVMPHGWLVQCYQPANGSMTCVPRLVAGYFGEALPVAGGACNACSFLPSSLDEVLRQP